MIVIRPGVHAEPHAAARGRAAVSELEAAAGAVEADDDVTVGRDRAGEVHNNLVVVGRASGADDEVVGAGEEQRAFGGRRGLVRV